MAPSSAASKREALEAVINQQLTLVRQQAIRATAEFLGSGPLDPDRLAREMGRFRDDARTPAALAILAASDAVTVAALDKGIEALDVADGVLTRRIEEIDRQITETEARQEAGASNREGDE